MDCGSQYLSWTKVYMYIYIYISMYMYIYTPIYIHVSYVQALLFNVK